MKLSTAQVDALKELINIGVGRAAGVLNEMVQAHISLQVPFVQILSSNEFRDNVSTLGEGQLAAVRLGFSGSFCGTAELVFPPESASNLVSVVTGEEPGTPELDAVRSGTLSEVGNILLNGVMGSIGNVLQRRVHYSLPNYIEDTLDNLVSPEGLESDSTILMARTRFTIEQLQVEGDIILLFEVGSFDELLAALSHISPDTGATE
jgi:chemotaxis protein CheC